MNAEKAEKSMEAKEKAHCRLSKLFEEVREEVSYTAEPEYLMRMFNQYARVMFGPHLTGVRTKTLDVAAKANMCLIAEKRKLPVPLDELAQAKHSWMRSVQQTLARLSGVDGEVIDHTYESLLMPQTIPVESFKRPTVVSDVNIVVYADGFVPVSSKKTSCVIVTDPDNTGALVFRSQHIFVVPTALTAAQTDSAFDKLRADTGFDLYPEDSVKSEVYKDADIYWVVDDGSYSLYDTVLPASRITHWLPNVIHA